MKDRFNDARSNLYPREMMMDVDTRSHGDRRLDVSSTPCQPQQPVLVIGAYTSLGL